MQNYSCTSALATAGSATNYIYEGVSNSHLPTTGHTLDLVW